MVPTIEEELKLYRACIEEMTEGDCGDMSCSRCAKNIPDSHFNLFRQLEIMIEG